MSDIEDDEEGGVPGIGTYEGDRDPNTQERHGHGRALLKNGDVYDGEYSQGKRHGQGVYRFKNKSRYEGSYEDGKKSGNGKFWYPDGSTYEGEWASDAPNGNGKYTYANGDTYEGNWVAGKKEGTGVYTYAATGVKYDGEWNAGKMEGQGTYVFEGHTYTGAFTEDQPLGAGRFAFDHGAVQDGQFVVKATAEEDSEVRPKWVGAAVVNINNDE